MSKDTELDRLKVAQDHAYQAKQSAYQKMQSAWNVRSSARDSLSRAHDAKQIAYEEQDKTWKRYQNVRNSNGPVIDSLNAQQEAAYQNMKQAFENASSAHERRDGASAKMHSTQGHSFKAESQGYVTKRRQLIEEIRTARAQHEASKPAFQRAKDNFSSAKRTFDSAKAEHEHLQSDFKRAKSEFDKAQGAFRSRLEMVREKGQNKRQFDKRMAERAGIPSQYLGDMRVVKDSDGNLNIYFGGYGKPDGPGHGHYVLDKFMTVTYKRDPRADHGSQNFTSNQDDYYDVILGVAPHAGDFGFRCKFRGYDAYVESNINTQGKKKIDIYYGPKGPFGEGHHHAVAYRETPLTFVSDELR